MKSGELRRADDGKMGNLPGNPKGRAPSLNGRTQAGPQVITRHGKPNAVIVSAEEWARKTARKGTLAGFLLGSPLPGGRP